MKNIRQADGDNPITVRGCMIVKQTTENEKKLELIFRKIRKVACDIFKKNCGDNWANWKIEIAKTETITFAHTFEQNEWSNFYLIWFDYVINFFKSFETRPQDHCASC